MRGLEVNIKKTKSLIFNNTGRLENVCFRCENKVVENVRKYSYLGVVFSNSGSFIEAKKELYQKALRLTLNFASVLSIINLKKYSFTCV